MAESTKILNNLRRQCSRREYCSGDILKKAVKALDGDKEQAQKVLNVLVEEKYVDDLRYAEAFARDKSSIAGWGVTKIRYMLSAKGVDRELISAALEEIDQSKADDRLVKLIENKKRSLKDDPQARMKLLRFALGRGYTYDEISCVLKDYEEL
jgi:regulatory protein